MECESSFELRAKASKANAVDGAIGEVSPFHELNAQRSCATGQLASLSPPDMTVSEPAHPERETSELRRGIGSTGVGIGAQRGAKSLPIRAKLIVGMRVDQHDRALLMAGVAPKELTWTSSARSCRSWGGGGLWPTSQEPICTIVPMRDRSWARRCGIGGATCG
ncbi:MAG: hypothetical protein NVSMB55_08770 [Mycobacteriales bacterium]